MYNKNTKGRHEMKVAINGIMQKEGSNQCNELERRQLSTCTIKVATNDMFKIKVQVTMISRKTKKGNNQQQIMIAINDM